MSNIVIVHDRLSATDRPQRYRIVESYSEYFPRYRPLLEGYAAKEHEAVHLAAWCAMQTTLSLDIIDDMHAGKLLFRAESFILRMVPDQVLDLYALYWRQARQAEQAGQSAERTAYHRILRLLEHDSSPTSHLLESLTATIRYYHRWAHEEIEPERMQFYRTVTEILREASLCIRAQEAGS